MKKIVLTINRKHSDLENAAITLDQGKQQAVFILLFTVMYLIRDLGGANVPDIVFSGFCAVAFILMDMGSCLGVYMFTTALTVPHNEIAIVYLVILFFKILTSGKAQVNGRMLMLTMGMLLLQLLNVTLFSFETANSIIYDYVTRMLIIIMPIFWYNDEYTAKDFSGALMCYAAGVILGGTVTLLLTAERVTWEVLLKGSGGNRLGKTYNTEEGMQTNYNANQLATMCAIAAAIILQHLDKKKTTKLIGFLLLGYLLFLVVLTRSRTGVLMMAMIGVIYYLILVVRRKKLFAGLLLLGMIGVIVFIIATLIPGVVEKVIGRFISQEDITGGRAELFADYIQTWVNNPWCFFFGYGIGTYYNVDTWNTPHNAITDVLISWGLTGMILVCGIVGMCFKKGAKGVDKKDRMIALLPATVALVSSMASQYLDTGYPHPRLCFLFLAVKAFETDKKQPINNSGSR